MDLSETACSLEFAKRVKSVELGQAKKNTSMESGNTSSRPRSASLAPTRR
jgi:hypothetical protein